MRREDRKEGNESEEDTRDECVIEKIQSLLADE
jgi:hypothetical protein